MGGLENGPGQMQPSEEQMQAAQEQPIVTIRVGDPSNDPDCKRTLDEWEANVKTQTEGNLKHIARETIANNNFLTFESQDMVEVGEGRKEERKAKMFVVLCGERSTMVRWEAPKGAWPKYQGMMNQMLESLTVF